ncbi:MAG: type I pullulanase [Bacilli bacterium]|nr:type I pullulanase [Bacilli bacterium]
MNYFLKAQLISLRRITLLFFSQNILPNDTNFYLYVDGKRKEILRVIRHTSNLNINFYELEMSIAFPFWHRCFIYIPHYPLQLIANSRAFDFLEAEELFSCPDQFLGNLYTPHQTTFRVWAPLSTRVYLRVSQGMGKFESYPMNRIEKGIYEIILDGDYENASYYYLVENNGTFRQARDPFARATTMNSLYSAVVDINKIKVIENHRPKTQINSLLDCVIYEVNVRDFTEGKHTDIVNKGKYLGFVEKGRKTSKNHPAGLDYLKYLGVTHVQLLPILDFDGVDDVRTNLSYNWGYDPISFFALEGSYSTAPEKPYVRMEEFKTMVNELHKNDIRVVIDVVYNHVYEYFDSDLEKIAPGYFFRTKKNGTLYNSSGCGNDFASEKPMARKIIIESAKNLVELYDIDGFRFDLMGLLDITTLKLLREETLKLKSDLVFYGEGWNMDSPLLKEDRASSENAALLPEFGFFNDMFRDIVKGSTFPDKLSEKGYINGDISYRFGANFVFHASVINHSYNPKFVYAHQSINYVECHDNNTLFDKLSVSNVEEEDNTLLKRIKLANAMNVLSFGVPFIHMGQEVGLSKYGFDNTYNRLNVNMMNWEQVDDKFDMVSYLKMIIDLRKTALPHLKLDSQEDIAKIFETIHCDNGLLVFYSDKKEYLKDYQKLLIIVNATNSNLNIDTDDYFTHMPVPLPEEMRTKNILVPPISFDIYYIK